MWLFIKQNAILSQSVTQRSHDIHSSVFSYNVSFVVPQICNDLSFDKDAITLASTSTFSTSVANLLDDDLCKLCVKI